MCMGALPLMKKAGVNPMFAVSPALALAGVGKKKKKPEIATPTTPPPIAGFGA